MRVIVCGSREWTDREQIAARLAELPGTATVVHGAARGADRIAGQEAEKLGLLVEPHRPEYHHYGPKRAPLIRNSKMAALGAELCVAFWDGRSTGTEDMMNKARAVGIPVEIVRRT